MKALLITVRGLQLSYLGCYGNEWISTPALDGLAVDGVVFDQHHACVPEAGAVRRERRTGFFQLPGVEIHGEDLLAELRRKNVHTQLIVDTTRPISEEFMSGWDHVERVALAEGSESPLEQLSEVARKSLQNPKGEDWLLWLDLATLLPPWEVPSEFSDPYFQEAAEDEVLTDSDEEADEAFEDEDEEEEQFVEMVEEDTDEAAHQEEMRGALLPDEEIAEEEEEEPLLPWFDPTTGLLDAADNTDFMRLQSSYAAAVSYVDAAIGVVLETLVAQGLSDDCLVIVTSDHGFALGEHGHIGDFRPQLHEEVWHVPLLMHLPRALNRAELKGHRVGVLTQAVDLHATLLACFSEASPQGHGQNLLPLASADAEEGRPYVCARWEMGKEVEVALRTLEWSLIVPLKAEGTRETQLFAKPDDRWEVNNVAQHRPELAEQMERYLRAFLEKPRGLSFSSPWVVQALTIEDSSRSDT